MCIRDSNKTLSGFMDRINDAFNNGGTPRASADDADDDDSGDDDDPLADYMDDWPVPQ